MDSPSRKLMTSLAFSLLAVVVFSASSAGAEFEQVHDVCRVTKDYSSCVAALNVDPRAAKATTFHSIGEIALQIAAKNATASRKYVDQMIMDPNTKPSWKPVLESCKANFDMAAWQFLTASRELSFDAMTANYDVRMASDEIYACLRSMRDSKQDIPPLVAACYRVKAHVTIGDAVTNRW
ncbi:hypothetical protein BT93_B1397 [Corymbia citriodora subsp. variegata]|nr:hypothetical protein BT93_B1397 [Corymbia citriodora subsp. variegata]